MLEFRRLKDDDENKLNALINVIETDLSDAAWWLPLKAKAKEHFFDLNWTIFQGAFDSGELVGACGLFLNPFEYGECADYIGASYNHTAEIGRCMVHPNYRGQNIMLSLNKILLKEAKNLNRTTIIATVHPDNISSNTSLIKLGMKVEKTIVKQKIYPRNILQMEI